MSYYLLGDKACGGYYRIPDPTGQGRILIGGGIPGRKICKHPPWRHPRRRARRRR